MVSLEQPNGKSGNAKIQLERGGDTCVESAISDAFVNAALHQSLVRDIPRPDASGS